MPEQQGNNKVITFIGGVRDGEIKIVSKDAIEIRVVDCEDFPTHVTKGMEFKDTPQKESTYREEPPGSGKFYLKSERIVLEDDEE